MNVKMANGISIRNVSNMFSFNQKKPNKARILPKLKKNTIPLKLNVKFETLMPSLIHKANNTNSGTAQSAVKTSDTKRGGRFSGSRNWWIISGFFARDWLKFDAEIKKWKKKLK